MAIIPSQLAYLPIKDQQALLDWLGYHGDWHLKTAQRALKDGHTNLGQYNFWDMGDRDDWLFFHNQEHGDIANTYGLGAPPDLTYWDEEDQNNFYNWLQAHALVHDNERKVLFPTG